MRYISPSIDIFSTYLCRRCHLLYESRVDIWRWLLGLRLLVSGEDEMAPKVRVIFSIWKGDDLRFGWGLELLSSCSLVVGNCLQPHFLAPQHSQPNSKTQYLTQTHVHHLSCILPWKFQQMKVIIVTVLGFWSRSITQFSPLLMRIGRDFELEGEGIYGAWSEMFVRGGEGIGVGFRNCISNSRDWIWI